MNLKDYYSILEIPPTATLSEIKKAYRLLAQKYHPDKNNSDPYKAAQFEQIKEAYETLSNSSRKTRYLQQRWYYQSMGKKFSSGAVTPASILKQSLELDKYVASLDAYRMDREGLSDYILELLNNDVIDQIKKSNDQAVNLNIVSSLLKSGNHLRFNQFEKVSKQLLKLANDNEEIKTMITTSFNSHKRKETIEKYQPLIIIVITLMICLSIYLLSR